MAVDSGPHSHRHAWPSLHSDGPRRFSTVPGEVLTVPLPESGLAADVQGNLYGATSTGGLHRGTVYKLSLQTNGTWSEKILHKFSALGLDGVNPSNQAVTVDRKGDAFGTTPNGGASKVGVLDENCPVATRDGYFAKAVEIPPLCPGG